MMRLKCKHCNEFEIEIETLEKDIKKLAVAVAHIQRNHPEQLQIANRKMLEHLFYIGELA